MYLTTRLTKVGGRSASGAVASFLPVALSWPLLVLLRSLSHLLFETLQVLSAEETLSHECSDEFGVHLVVLEGVGRQIDLFCSGAQHSTTLQVREHAVGDSRQLPSHRLSAELLSQEIHGCGGLVQLVLADDLPLGRVPAEVADHLPSSTGRGHEKTLVSLVALCQAAVTADLCKVRQL